MIEKVLKPIRFDKDVDVLVVARDGEKFYVADSNTVLTEIDKPLVEMKPKPLLEWAMLNNYPLTKFVRAQRVLSAKFFGMR
jgi:hypothetical protein